MSLNNLWEEVFKTKLGEFCYVFTPGLILCYFQNHRIFSCPDNKVAKIISSKIYFSLHLVPIDVVSLQSILAIFTEIGRGVDCLFNGHVSFHIRAVGLQNRFLIHDPIWGGTKNARQIKPNSSFLDSLSS